MKKISLYTASHEIKDLLLEANDQWVCDVYQIVSGKKAEVYQDVIIVTEEGRDEGFLTPDEAVELIAELLEESKVEVVAKAYQKVKEGNVKIEDESHISWSK